jgi:hypothetical protein
MGFSLHRRRGRGRSLVGRRATITRANARGGNISVCAAISPTSGLIKYRVKVGGFNGDEYAQFLTELIRDYTHPSIDSLLRYGQRAFPSQSSSCSSI